MPEIEEGGGEVQELSDTCCLGIWSPGSTQEWTGQTGEWNAGKNTHLTQVCQLWNMTEKLEKEGR